MRKIIIVLSAFLLPSAVIAAEYANSEHAQKTLDIFTRIIAVETSKNLGNVPEVANYLADELIAAGIPKEDVEVLPVGETAVLIARYRGDGSSGTAPIRPAFSSRSPHWSLPSG